VRLPLRPTHRHPRRPPLARTAVGGRRPGGDAGDPSGAARGRRQLPGRQGLRGRGPRAGHGQRGHGEPHARPAGRQDRRRGAHEAHGRGVRGPRHRPAGAHRHPDGRAAGLGQDDDGGQARPPPAEGREEARTRGLRRLPSGRRAPARHGRRPGRRPRLRAGDGRRPGRHRGVGRPAGATAGPGRGHHRHRRPAARRRRADGRARPHPGRDDAAQRAPRTRLDDRPGRRQRGADLPGARRVRRAGPHEARRRRARWRGAERAGRHRRADQVRLGGREARPVRGVPSRPDGVAHPRHGRRAVAHRARRGDDRRQEGRGARAEDPPLGVHARRPARPAPVDPQDGLARLDPEDAARRGQGAAQHAGRRPAARSGRGDYPLDDARGATPARARQRLPPLAHRQGVRDQRAADQPAAAAAQADEEDDEAADGRRGRQGAPVAPDAAGRTPRRRTRKEV
ncbi:MAG: Signal recognition particle protein Ffh, partial [uncultured Thermoleophilia bacterium]